MMKRNRTNDLHTMGNLLDISEAGILRRSDRASLSVRTALRAGAGSSNGGEDNLGTPPSGGTGTNNGGGSSGSGLPPIVPGGAGSSIVRQT